MGATHVTATIRNPAEPDRSWGGLFLVDTRATVGQIEFMGEFVGETILFGDADAAPLLGVTALESVGIEVDPSTQQLKRLPAVRLKSLRTSGRNFPFRRVS